MKGVVGSSGSELRHEMLCGKYRARDGDGYSRKFERAVARDFYEQRVNENPKELHRAWLI